MGISPALLTLYAELTQQVHAAGTRPGTVYAQTSKGVRYLYSRRNVGTARVDSFIGPAADPTAQEAAAAIRREQALARQRRKIVSLLKSGGMPGPAPALGAVLDAMADAGLFKTAVLVGTAAYGAMSPLVGATLPAASLMTQDADVATATLALASDEPGQSMLAVLRRADRSFEAVPGLDRAAPPAAFRSASGFMVDLLTPVLRRDDTNPMPLPALAAGAVPPQHLAWLIESPVPAVALHGAGVPVRIPQPARFAVHKLIVAQKRAAHERPKRAKDLTQAAALIAAMQRSDPFALDDAKADAERQGRAGWAEPIARSLAELAMRIETDG